MALAELRHGYFVEPTPVTVPSPPHADDDIPPLPEVPKMTHVATPSPPRIPYVFIGSFVFTLIVLTVLASALR
jgi:hypothetical protein